MTACHTHRGFTFIELCLGLVVMSLVMSALAGFSLAMVSAWKSSEKSQGLTLLGNQAAIRLQDAIRQAKLIGAFRGGSIDGTSAGAAVLIWGSDANGDAEIQAAEVELIEHDPDSKTLRLYPSGQGDAVSKWHYTTFVTPDTIDQFRTGRSYTLLARGVYGASFQTAGTTSTAQNPILRYALKLVSDSDPTPLIQYGAATVRAPMAQPNY